MRVYILLLLFGLFSCPIYGQTVAPDQNNRDAEIVAAKYDAALKAYRWDAAAELMHPNALTELKNLLHPLVETHRQAIGVRIFEASTVEQFDGLSGEEAFTRLLQSIVVRQTGRENQELIAAHGKIIGSMREREDLVHVLFRPLVPPKMESAPESVVLRTLKLTSEGWKVMLPRELRPIFREWQAAMPLSIVDVLAADGCNTEDLLRSATRQWRLDKYLQIDDAYKWIYQATRGGEHAVTSRESARQWLEGEWQGLTSANNDESIWVPLCSGGEIGRLNLRPFKAKGGKAEDLLDAFLASSREYKGGRTDFLDAWLELGRGLKKGSIGKLDHKSWTKLDTEMKAKDYPAIHHSETYEKARHPAYRVLTRAQYELLLQQLK